MEVGLSSFVYNNIKISKNNFKGSDNMNSPLNDDIPMGLGMALAKNLDAMQMFTEMSVEKQQEVINKTHSIKSKKEMQSFVNSIANSRFTT